MTSLMLTSQKDAEKQPKILIFLVDKIHKGGGNTWSSNAKMQV